MLYFTATGRRDEHHTIFEQRLFQAEATLARGSDRTYRLVDWQGLREIVTPDPRSEEQTSELQSLMRSSYAVFCLQKKTQYDTSKKVTSHNTNNTHRYNI